MRARQLWPDGRWIEDFCAPTTMDVVMRAP
jgi:hypothetical protein